ncbi:MAG: prolipoprotein diacylglyceryl transferase, partial [Actinobacteria bacterium]|nr:prolipoprotein diacylglyceryl transferase [Actinomycetota bacterium]
ILAPGLILGQAIGRWGNFFNQEAFGRPTNLPWGIYIEPTIRQLYGYGSSEYFHPTFLYESIANLLLFALLMLMHRFYKNKPDRIPYGLILCVYLGIYSIYRTFIESYRIDSSFWGPVKVVYVINFVTIIGAFIIAYHVIKKFKEKKQLEDNAEK